MRNLWGSLVSVRSEASWERKLLAAAYLHHRDNYRGTEVPRRTTYDNTAESFLETYRDGFVGYLMPQDDDWLQLVPRMQSEERKGSFRAGRFAPAISLDSKPGLLKYCEGLTQAALTAYADSGYYQVASMSAMDYLVFGTLYVIAEEDARSSLPYYRCYDPQEVCIAENYRGAVDVFVRRFFADARDLVRQYPDAGLTMLQDIVRAGGGEQSSIECFEAILPKGYLFDGSRAIRCGDGRDYVHLLYIPMEEKLAFESGYDSFPVAVARDGHDNSCTPYGTSVAERNLDDIIILDEMSRIRLEMQQKNVNPPMSVPYSLQGNYSSRPGARNYVSDMSQTPQPILNGFDYSTLINDISDKREQLRMSLRADLFRTVLGSTDSRKTAYEVSEKKNEAMTLLMMSIGNYKKEFIDPIFMRTLAILYRGHIVEAPSQAVDMDYDTPVSEKSFMSFLRNCRTELNSVFVQRVSAYLQYDGLVAGLNTLTALMQIMPEAVDNIDKDAFTRYILYGAGMPKAVFLERKEVQKAHEQRAEMQMQQYQAQLAEQQSKATANNAKAEAMQSGMVSAGGAA